MKRKITYSAIVVIGLIGGSWLAAQQREQPRRTTPAVQPAAGSAAEAATTGSLLPSAVEPASQVTTARPLTRASGAPAVNRFGQIGYPAAEGMTYSAQGSMHPYPGFGRRMTQEDAARMDAFRQAIGQLRNAKGNEAQLSARESVSKLVSEQLDADLASREKELDAIEERAKELRKQLDERKTAKPEMVKMLTMLIDNPQVGLGIPTEWMQMLMQGERGWAAQPNYASPQNALVAPGAAYPIGVPYVPSQYSTGQYAPNNTYEVSETPAANSENTPGTRLPR